MMDVEVGVVEVQRVIARPPAHCSRANAAALQAATLSVAGASGIDGLRWEAINTAPRPLLKV